MPRRGMPFVPQLEAVSGMREAQLPDRPAVYWMRDAYLHSHILFGRLRTEGRYNASLGTLMQSMCTLLRGRVRPHPDERTCWSKLECESCKRRATVQAWH